MGIEKAMRAEKDSMGLVHVPREALYGAQTQRAIENFPISGLKPWRAFIWSVGIIKRTASEVNSELGLLDVELAGAISQAAQLEKAVGGDLRHRHEDRSVTMEEIKAALDDLRRLTEGGIVG